MKKKEKHVTQNEKTIKQDKDKNENLRKKEKETEVENNAIKDVEDPTKKGAKKTKSANGKGIENDHIKGATNELKRTKSKKTTGSKHKRKESSKNLFELSSYFYNGEETTSEKSTNTGTKKKC